MTYLDEHPSEVKNAGYYRRQMKLLEEKLAAKDAEIAELKAELKLELQRRWDGNEQNSKELAAAHQEIAALKGDAEPVAWLNPDPLCYDGCKFTIKPTQWQKENHIPLYLHPPTEDKRDAERYRWLRHGDNDDVVLNYAGEIAYLLRNEMLDAAIDAAMEGEGMSDFETQGGEGMSDFETQEVEQQHKHIPCAKYPDLFEYHFAIAGEGAHAYNWSDKPHRLVYDLTRIAAGHRDEITRLKAELAALKGDAEPVTNSLLSASDDGEEVHLMMYAGGANPDGLWGNLTLEFRKPNEEPRLRSYRAIDLHPPTEDKRDAALYMELLYAVGKKYPNETRHETALRYIRQAEAGTESGCKAMQGKDE